MALAQHRQVVTVAGVKIINQGLKTVWRDMSPLGYDASHRRHFSEGMAVK